MSSEAGAARQAPGEVSVTIRTRGLSKAYHVYRRPQDRLKQILWRGRRRFYREFFALRDVDLEIRRGETIGIVGRNGAGKSTLLQILCGTLEPTSGEVQADGHVAPLLTIGAGFNPEFTGRENVFVNAAILGLSLDETRARLEAIVDFSEIGDFFDQPVKSYSSGMYARLAFAVAINADPEILVIDEILSVGDEAFTRKCFARIEQIKKRGSTILFASHSAGAVIALCDRAVLLEAGELLLTADPKTVISRYQKLIHAPQSRIPKIVEEIRRLDAQRTAAPAEPRSSTRVQPAFDGHEIRERRDPRLESKSTLEFTQRGARITNAKILDVDGRRRNVLESGKTYTFSYRVDFVEAALCVRFGMMLRVVTGLDLGGQTSHRPGEGVDVEAGTTATVRFPFRASLTSGVYFLNAGVLGVRHGKEVYLHRILDVTMFRVAAQGPGRVTGRVDLSVTEADICLEPSES